MAIKKIIIIVILLGIYSISLASNLSEIGVISLKGRSIRGQECFLWTNETIDTKGWVGLYSSIAIDSSGNPHISYYSDDGLKYVYWGGKFWIYYMVDDKDGTGEATSIALDSLDYPHITYYDEVNNELKYVYLTGSSWDFQTIDSGEGTGFFNSLELDSLDYPHLSYYDGVKDCLKYAYWTGNFWLSETVDDEGDVGIYNSLALDSLNNPHICYYDWTRHSLKYAYWTGIKWKIQIVDDSYWVGEYPSIALDSLDNPHISYHDWENNSLKYAYWTGSSWNITNIDYENIVGLCTSIVIDAFDNPHISYYDWENGDLKYAYKIDNSWLIEIVDSDGSVGFDSSLALDSSNNPHISYFYLDDMDLKYAKGIYDITPPESFTPIAEPCNWTSNTQPVIKFSTNDAITGIDHYELKIDDGNYTEQTSPYTLPPQSDGIHNITIRAFDKKLNYIEGYVNIYIDTIKPENLTIKTDILSWINNAQPVLIFSANDTISGIDRFEVKIDDKEFNKQESPYTLQPLSDGDHNISVRVYDKASNYQDIYINIYIDATGPSIIHTPIKNVKNGVSIPVKAIITENQCGINEIALFFKKTTDDFYLKLIMSADNDTYFATIPSEFVTLEGIEYYIKAMDNYFPSNIRYFGGYGETDIKPIPENDIDIKVSKKETIPPRIIDKLPIGSEVSRNIEITITFSEPMMQNLTENGFSMIPSINGTFSWIGNKLIFAPDIDLDYNTEYTVIISQVAQDLEGNNLEKEEKWTFTTTKKGEDFDNDSLPNWWEDKYGLNPGNPLDTNSDNDGDGYTNLQEYLGNSDPTDSTSFPSLGDPPIARLLLSATKIKLNELIIFDASKSSDLNGEVEIYFFDFGDKTNSGWVTSAIIDHKYTRIGKYTIKLIVIDNNGLLSEEITKEIVVNGDIESKDKGIYTWLLGSFIIIFIELIIIILLFFLLKRPKKPLSKRNFKKE